MCMDRSTADFDRIAGTRLGTLWFLPVAGVIFGGIGIQTLAEGSLVLGTVWVAAGAMSLSTFAWSWNERRVARALFAWILDNEERLRSGSVVWRGRELTMSTRVTQYGVSVGLLVLATTFRTCPKVRGSAVVPVVATALFGWWAFPLGPLLTIGTITGNLRGGESRTIGQLVTALGAAPAPHSPWWRRTLALDSGNVVSIAANLAIALVLLVLASLISVAVVKSLLSS